MRFSAVCCPLGLSAGPERARPEVTIGGDASWNVLCELRKNYATDISILPSCIWIFIGYLIYLDRIPLSNSITLPS